MRHGGMDTQKRDGLTNHISLQLAVVIRRPLQL